MGGFSVRILLSVFLTRSIPVAYKINNSVSLHPSQIVYKNNSIPRRLSNTTETFGGNSLKQGHCDLLLQNLGFLINLKKSVLQPTQTIKFLGIIIDTVVMTKSWPKEKVQSISKYIQNILSMQEVSMKNPANLLGTLSSTALAILSASMYMR